MKSLILVLSLAGAAMCQSTQSVTKPVATVGGVPITEAELNSAAAGRLEELELEMMQFEIGQERKRYDAMEKALARLLEEKLVDMEAAKRKISKDALLGEVYAKVPVPTDEQVKSFYDENKARINVSGDPLPQIRQYLIQQKRAQLFGEFIAGLKVSHQVSSFLEPHRVQIETSGFPSRGPASAPVTIVEFSDFECPFCANIFPTIKEVEKNYAGKVRLVYRQFPLISIHPNAQKAAEASLCANDQQKFWELHDAMFANIRNIGVPALKAKAAELQLNTTAFNACLDSGKYAETVKKDVKEGMRVGVTGTPAMLINGRLLTGAQPYSEISKIIDDELSRSAVKK